MINLKTLCSDSHRISAEKGWLDGEKRPFAAIAALIHSELSEALEDFRNNRKLDEIYYESKDGSSCDDDLVRGRRYLDLPSAEQAKFKPCGIPIELADVVIRIAQHCGTEGWDLASVVDYKNSLTRRLSWGGFEETLAWAHLFVSRAFMASKNPNFSEVVSGLAASNTTNTALSELANAFLVIQDFCSFPLEHGPRIDLEVAVQIKQAYNETREFRHGGKKL